MNLQPQPGKSQDEQIAWDILARIAVDLGSLDLAKFPEFVERLRRIKLIASVLLITAPSGLRSEFEKDATVLANNISSIRDRAFAIAEPLNWAWRDLKANQEQIQTGQKSLAPGSNVSEILDRLDSALDEIATLMGHLRTTSDHLDKADDNERLCWILNAKNKAQMFARHHLHSLFRKRGGLNLDTHIVREIADLYEFSFGKPFSAYTPNSTDKRDEDDPQYKGPSITFACEVLLALELSHLIAPISGHATDHRVLLCDRIGHIWKNDRKRSHDSSAKL